MTHTWRQATLIIAGILAACAVFELILQCTDGNVYTTLPVDPTSGLSIHTPNSSYLVSRPCYENTVVINNWGLHGPPVSLEKGKGVFRIIILGSSFVEAEQVPITDMVSSVLERKLNADPHQTQTYEVIPIGFSGNGTFLDTLYFERFGESLKPDLVIDLETDYEFQSGRGNPQFSNDGQVNLSLPVIVPSTNPLVTRIKDAYHQSKLIMNLLTRYTVLKQNILNFFTIPFVSSPVATTSSSVDQASPDAVEWDKETKLTDALVGVVRAAHAQFLLASWATPEASTSTSQELAMELQGISDRDHFAYLDLDQPISLEAAAEGRSPVWSCDDHWSPDGHRYAADAIEAYLEEHPELLVQGSSH